MRGYPSPRWVTGAAMLSQGTQIEQTNKLVVARISDQELTGLQMQEVVNELTQHMRYENAMFFVLDMTSVQFISSDCLGCLVTFLRDLEHMRGRIALANCQPNVAFLFKVTRLDTAFTLYDDLEEACTDIIHG